MVMIFAHEKVRKYLLEHGIVYTYRKHHKKTADGVRLQIGDDWATDRRTGNKIADIHITPMERVDGLNMSRILAKYIYESGFAFGFGFVRFDASVRRWAKAITSLNPNAPVRGWIYKVEVRGVKSNSST